MQDAISIRIDAIRSSGRSHYSDSLAGRQSDIVVLYHSKRPAISQIHSHLHSGFPRESFLRCRACDATSDCTNSRPQLAPRTLAHRGTRDTTDYRSTSGADIGSRPFDQHRPDMNNLSVENVGGALGFTPPIDFSGLLGRAASDKCRTDSS